MSIYPEIQAIENRVYRGTATAKERKFLKDYDRMLDKACDIQFYTHMGISLLALGFLGACIAFWAWGLIYAKF